MEDSPHLRSGTYGDCSAIAEIYNHWIDVGGSTMDESHLSATDIRSHMDALLEREVYVVLEWGPRILGWGLIKRYDDRAGYCLTCEVATYLRPECLGQGYGTTIKAELIERSRGLGYHHIVSMVVSSNAASIRSNLKLGFEVVGVQKEIGFQKGQWQDITILQLIL